MASFVMAKSPRLVIAPPLPPSRFPVPVHRAEPARSTTPPLSVLSAVPLRFSCAPEGMDTRQLERIEPPDQLKTPLVAIANSPLVMLPLPLKLRLLTTALLPP